MTHAGQPYMAAAGFKGDHEKFAWCAFVGVHQYWMQRSFHGSWAQQDEQPGLVLSAYIRFVPRVQLSVALQRARDCQVNWAVLLDGLHE